MSGQGLQESARFVSQAQQRPGCQRHANHAGLGSMQAGGWTADAAAQAQRASGWTRLLHRRQPVLPVRPATFRAVALKRDFTAPSARYKAGRPWFQGACHGADLASLAPGTPLPAFGIAPWPPRPPGSCPGAACGPACSTGA